MKNAKFVLIPRSNLQTIDLAGKRGIHVVRTNQRGEIVVEMTPQRAGLLKNEILDVKVERVVPLRPA